MDKYRINRINSNPDAIGVKIYIKAIISGEEVWQMREVITHSDHVIQGSLKTHFGLGDANEIDSLIIVWPNQEEEIYTDILADQFLKFEKTSIVISAQVMINEPSFIVSPNPGDGSLQIKLELDKPKIIHIQVVDNLGRKVASVFSGDLEIGLHTFNWSFNISERNLNGDIYFIILQI